jgi:hypothetical protein
VTGTNAKCEDCNLLQATITYGLGAQRCTLCSETFNFKIRSERKVKQDLEDKRRLEYQPTMDAAHEAGENCEAEWCQECCDHEFDDGEGYHCLGCGLDGSEQVLSAAYDRAKDLRKYGP